MEYDLNNLGLDEAEWKAMQDCLDLVEEEDLEEVLKRPAVFCSTCGKRVNPTRLALCPDTTVCTEHAQAGHGQPPRVKAMMIFDHKTGGTICMMPEKVFNEAKRLSDRKGNMSILRKVSPSKA